MAVYNEQGNKTAVDNGNATIKLTSKRIIKAFKLKSTKN